MIKLPREIAHMIKTIEDAGFEAYAVGGCVRDSILGKHPEDWDLTSNASRDTLEALFPDAVIINKKLGVMRITEGEVTADLAAFRIDGEYKDYRRPEAVVFTKEIGEDLRRRDFTMNAIAISPERGVVDPYEGRSDIEKRLIRGIGDPRMRLEEDALRILRGIRFAAQLDFELDDETFQAMKEKVSLLAHISVERILDEFTKTLTAQKSGKGLELYLETGAIANILGEECMNSATEQELENLVLLAKNIDRTECEMKFRAALIYLCFEKDRALRAAKIIGYSNEMKRLLQLAIHHLDELGRISGKVELKQFINKIGLDDYDYLENLSMRKCMVYGLDEVALRNRNSLFQSIRNNQEPIFIDELDLDGKDLIRVGICEGVEIGRILNDLLDLVHESPDKNVNTTLLGIVKDKINSLGNC